MELKLFAVLLGGKPLGCTIEQHNMFFGVATEIEDLYPAIKTFWPAAPKVHVDAYMVLDQIGDFDITPVQRDGVSPEEDGDRVFFVNLGGYREGVFEELHKKLFVVACDEFTALQAVRGDPFFSECPVEPHIDDKMQLGEFDDDSPIDVGAHIAPLGFGITVIKSRSGSAVYPKAIIGYRKIP